MSWKNLHFRPPILKDAVVNGYGSDLLLIRLAGERCTTFAGYILLLKSKPSVYQICGRGLPTHEVIPSRIEWMEVPE